MPRITSIYVTRSKSFKPIAIRRSIMASLTWQSVNSDRCLQVPIQIQKQKARKEWNDRRKVPSIFFLNQTAQRDLDVTGFFANSKAQGWWVSSQNNPTHLGCSSPSLHYREEKEEHKTKEIPTEAFWHQNKRQRKWHCLQRLGHNRKTGSTLESSPKDALECCGEGSNSSSSSSSSYFFFFFW